MTLETELAKIRESTADEINEAIFQKIDGLLIEEYPAVGIHQFYTESFEYRNYGYIISISIFFNTQKHEEIYCYKDSLFLGVTPHTNSVDICNEARMILKKYAFLCFSQHIGKNNVNDVILETHSNARKQIDFFLKNKNRYYKYAAARMIE